MRALPIPERGGSIDELRRFVNVGSEDDWKLLASYLVRAFCSADPYPMLVLNGQQGAAKSTLTRVIRALIDPNEAPIRTFPGSERDLFIGASQSWVQAFDNLSQLPARQSDALCRLATGGSLVTRKLFTDGDEAVFSATRPVVLNGIEDLVIRGDLLDRSIVFQLPTLSRAQRQDERTFWQAFESARPRILGALLDAVSTALRNQDHVELPELPRMADFAIFSCATAPAFGWTPEDFMDAYEQNIRSASDIALESSPVAQAVLNLMEHYTVWEGTATQLLATLSSYFDGMPKRECPQTPQKLSNELRRLEPNLLKAGVTFTSYRKNGGTRERMITLSREPGDEPLPPNSASGPGDEPLSPESPSGPSSPNFSSGQHDGVPVTRLIEIFESTCQSYLEDEHLDLAA
jgi:hypothetical protein